MQAAKSKNSTESLKPMSVPQFALETGISVRKAWQLIADRRIEARKVDKRVIIPRKSAEAFSESCAVPIFDAEAMANNILTKRCGN